jgi:hypothetical protein
VNRNSIEQHRTISRHIEIVGSIYIGSVDMHIVSASAEGCRQAVDRANGTTVTDRGIVCWHDVQDAQFARYCRRLGSSRCRRLRGAH